MRNLLHTRSMRLHVSIESTNKKKEYITTSFRKCVISAGLPLKRRHTADDGRQIQTEHAPRDYGQLYHCIAAAGYDEVYVQGNESSATDTCDNKC